MKPSEAVEYLRNSELVEHEANELILIVEAQQKVVDAAKEMVKCQNGGYVEFHVYYGKALKACEKALAELEEL